MRVILVCLVDRDGRQSVTVSVWFDSTGAAIVEVMEQGQGQAEDAMASGLAAGSSRSRSPRRMTPISIGYPPAYAVGVSTPCANETSSGEPLATGEPSTPHPEIKQEGRHREAATALEKILSVLIDQMQDNASDHDMKSFAAQLNNVSEAFMPELLQELQTFWSPTFRQD